jgi:hypothetical protein
MKAGSFSADWTRDVSEGVIFRLDEMAEKSEEEMEVKRLARSGTVGVEEEEAEAALALALVALADFDMTRREAMTSGTGRRGEAGEGWCSGRW